MNIRQSIFSTLIISTSLLSALTFSSSEAHAQNSRNFQQYDWGSMPHKYKDFLSKPANQHIVDAMVSAIDSEYYLEKAPELKQIHPLVEEWIDKRNAFLTRKIGDSLELLESGQSSLIDYNPEQNIQKCAIISGETCSEKSKHLPYQEQRKANLACKIDHIERNCQDWKEHTTPLYKTTQIIASHIALALWMDVNDRVPWSLTNNTSEELHSMWKEKNVLMAYTSYEMLNTTTRRFTTKHPSLDSVTVADIASFFSPKFTYIYNSSPYENYQWLMESFGTKISASSTQEEALRELFKLTQKFEHGSSSDIFYKNRAGQSTPIDVESSIDVPRYMPVPFSFLRLRTPHMAIKGCHSATRIVHSLAKTLNIPSSIVLGNNALPAAESPFSLNHSMLYFPTVDRWLSHGDDIYGERDLFRYIEDKLDITIPKSQFTKAAELAACKGQDSVGMCISSRWKINKTLEGYLTDPANHKTCLEMVRGTLPGNHDALIFSDSERSNMLSKLGFSSDASYEQACKDKWNHIFGS
ncbi:hypothetical protein VINI7043_26605 [Vibrio nigripulchritudo ATCC 27043]|uniref:hypothetical protein n=1 Tax=Vibrio nigripulchritudo TaxID=28173 RepID=UPI00021C2A8D|nr:hypothetical protein [Vibrio nigripulchritudo]EGU55368.1 hypothetical protein VINI7043_26605 [Vibrio nigripulchritudo ATCC 27043]